MAGARRSFGNAPAIQRLGQDKGWAEESDESWFCMIAKPLTLIARRSYEYFCRIILLCTFLLLLSGKAFDAPLAVSKDVKMTGGWRCNAYGRMRNWSTYTGPPQPTKEAAQRDAMADCRKDAVGCQPSGCWPVDLN